MAGYGPPDPLSRETIRTMVAAVRPDWTVRVVEPCERGSDVLYFLTVGTDDGSREIALKYCRFADASGFLTEPRVLSLIASETGVPVPEVEAVVDEHDELPAPYFLMERRAGTPLSDEIVDDDRLVGVARDAGRYLGAVHRIREFDAFGRLEPADCGTERGDGGADGTTESEATSHDPGSVAVAESADSWPEWFHEVATAPLDHLDDTRFSDLVPGLRNRMASVRDRLREEEPTSVLCHGDYRPGNVLVDGDRTTAVLGWRTALAAPAEYDLARAESHLAGGRGLDDPVRRRLRDALYEGYDRTNRLDRDDGFVARREGYLLAARIEAMRWHPYRLGDADAEHRAAVAAGHRAFVEALQ